MKKSAYVGIESVSYPPERALDLVVFHGEDIEEIRKRDTRTFLDASCRYAAINKVFVVPGLYIRDGFLSLCLIDDSGIFTGEQRAIHLNSRYFGDLARNDSIKIFDTPFGKIFLCPDVDIYKPEVIRAAALMGAQIIIGCQYINDADYCEEMILAGPWQEAQQNCVFIINTSNHGGNIIGPCQATEDLSGFIAKGGCNASIHAELDFEKRMAAFRAFSVLDSLNPGLYIRHSEELCR